MSNETAHFLTFMSNRKTFPGLGEMKLPFSLPAQGSTRALANQQVLDFFKPSET